VDTLTETAAGGERALLGLAVNLPADRWDVWTCTTRQSGGPPIEQLRAAGVTHVDLERKGKADLRGHLALLRLIRKVRPTIVHSHMFGSNVWGTIFGHLARVPVIVAHEQTWSYEGKPLRRFLDGRVIGRWADAFIAVSTADAERMVSVEGVPEDKIHMIPNAWMDRPRESGIDLRAELGIAPDAPVAAGVMVMRPQKRLDVMVEAFAVTLRELPEAHLVLVGEGDEFPMVRDSIVDLGLEERIHVLGYREDVGTVWRMADIQVLSSDFEGTPLSVLEGMASGVPVVATNVGGLPDITDERCARLVPRRDPEALGTAIAAVLGDRELQREMSAAASARADEFTAPAHARKCEALYEQLLAQRAPGTRDASAAPTSSAHDAG
jgi:glycosyltransferase involved in cell wall biosynthesis